MAALLPPSSVNGVFWFAFFTFLVATLVLYISAEWLPRKYRAFHWLLTVLTATSSLTYLVLAGTYLGFTVIDDSCVFWLRYIDFAITIPLLLLALGLLSGTRLVETLFLSAMASLLFFTQLFNALHVEKNRYLFFALNLVFFLPILSALTAGYRAQAQLIHGPLVASRVGHLSLITLLFLIVQQLFTLLTHCLHYIQDSNDVIAISIADVIAKVSIAAVMVMSGEVVMKAVDGDQLLSALCGEAEGETGEEGVETSLRGMRMKGGDVSHMRPEATERTSLRGKV